MIWQVDDIAAIILGGSGWVTYLMTPCGAAAVDKLTPTSLAKLPCNTTLQTLCLGLQS